MVAIDFTGASPPSEQIAGQLRGQIITGRLVPGERLPTVRQLARDLGVATGTVAKAYRQLETEGLVHANARAGTIVSESARSLPAAVLTAARTLYDTATSHGLDRDETIAALAGMWATQDRP